MGEIKVKARLENSEDLALLEKGYLESRQVRREEIEAIVDTGAVMSLIPQDLALRLGLRIIDTITVRLADDRIATMPKAGFVYLTVSGRPMVTSFLVGPPGCAPLIGQLVMEELDLIADPNKRTLTPRPESPDHPMLNLKRLPAVSSRSSIQYASALGCPTNERLDRCI